MREIIHSFSALAFLQTFLAKLIFRKPASHLPRATRNLCFPFDHEAAPATISGIHQVGQSSLCSISVQYDKSPEERMLFTTEMLGPWVCQ